MANGDNLPFQGLDVIPFTAITSEWGDGIGANLLALAAGTGLDDGAVTTAKIAGGAVTPGKLADSAVAAFVSTTQSTASTTPTGLATPVTVSVTVGPNGKLLVGISSECVNNTAHGLARASFALSGANTLAAAAARSVYVQAYANNAGGMVGGTFLLTGLNPGATTVTMQFYVSSGTGSFAQRSLWALPL